MRNKRGLSSVYGASLLFFSTAKRKVTKESAAQKNRSTHMAGARLPFFGWLCFFLCCFAVCEGQTSVNHETGDSCVYSPFTGKWTCYNNGSPVPGSGANRALLMNDTVALVATRWWVRYWVDSLFLTSVAGVSLTQMNDSLVYYMPLRDTNLHGYCITLDYFNAHGGVQVNSDWNAGSGVAQILNKPTIPAAQVNSDWNAVSGVAQVLNKPSALPPNGSAGGDLTGTYPNPTVASGAISLAKMANMATASVLGRNTAGTGTPEVLSMATLRTMLGLATIATSGAYSDLSGTPSALPPNGSAGGDLTGTYPNPTVASGAISLAKMANIATASILGRNTAGTGVPEVLSATTVRSILGLATVATTGAYSDLSGTPAALPPNGSAGGDLTGTYPNPTVASGAISLAKMANMATASILGRNTAGTGVPEVLSATTVRSILGLAAVATTGAYSDLSGTPAALPPNGSAGGDLTGTYPNPSLKNTGTAGTYGDATHVAQFTTDAQGRVTAVTAVTITGGGGGGTIDAVTAGTLTTITVTSHAGTFDGGSTGVGTVFQKITLDASATTTITFSHMEIGKGYRLYITEQTSSAVAFAAAPLVAWGQSGVPVLTGTNGAKDMWDITYDGTNVWIVPHINFN